jgi:hypothetical protein
MIANMPGIWGCPPVFLPERMGGKKDLPANRTEEQNAPRDIRAGSTLRSGPM